MVAFSPTAALVVVHFAEPKNVVDADSGFYGAGSFARGAWHDATIVLSYENMQHSGRWLWRRSC